MTQDEIIELARQAGCPMANMMPMYFTDTQLLVMLEAFAALVASAEREAINKEAKAHLEELRKNFNAESAELRLHMWSQEKQA